MKETRYYFIRGNTFNYILNKGCGWPMSNEFHFYKATKKDMDEIIRLRLELLKEVGEMNTSEDEYLMKNATKEYLQDALANNVIISYIAKKDGEAVSISGMVLFKRPPYLENLQGLEAYILNMYTVPKYRGKGLAGKLLEYYINEAKSSGVKRIWLHASHDGKHLYKKMGFTMKDNEMELFL